MVLRGGPIGAGAGACVEDGAVAAGEGAAGEDGASVAATVLSVPGLLCLEPPLRRLLLHRWLERRARPAASRASVLALESLLRVPGSAERDLGGGWRGVKEYDELSLVAGLAAGARRRSRRHRRG